jgi:hypothetical protein
MDSPTAAAVCIAAPSWFWFGLLLLLLFFLSAARFLTALTALICRNHHNI